MPDKEWILMITYSGKAFQGGLSSLNTITLARIKKFAILEEIINFLSQCNQKRNKRSVLPNGPLRELL